MTPKHIGAMEALFVYTKGVCHDTVNEKFNTTKMHEVNNAKTALSIFLISV
jgi:hypothetical protein